MQASPYGSQITHNLAAAFFTLLLLSSAFSVFPQTSGPDLQKVLRSTAELIDAEITALESGEPVVKVLKSKEKRQIGVFGIVRLRQIREVSMAFFRESLTQKANKSVLAGGRFSSPPVLDDLRALRLDKSDFNDLKTCQPGDCKLKLPAEMIKQLRAAVDPDTLESEARVTKLFGEYLIAYVTDYLVRGNKALAHYNNEKVPVRLADEHRQLLDGSPLIHSLAPEFVNYLDRFPDIELAGTASTIDWTQVTFGFKPFVTVTHSISYDRPDAGPLRCVIATRQIYATRYVDSSLAMSMLVRTSAADGTTQDHLIFTDVSRSDALGGALSGIKRSVVGADATARVKELLQRSKINLETGPARARPSASEPKPAGIIDSIRATPGETVVFTLLAILVGSGLYIAYRRLRH